MGLFDMFSKKNNNKVSEINQEVVISKLAKSMIEQLGYSYKVFPAGTSYETIMNAYNVSFEQGKNKGFTPVIVPADNVLDEYFGIMKDDDYSLEEILNKPVDAAEGKKILDARFTEYLQDCMEGNVEDLIGEFDEEPQCISQYTSFRNYNTGLSDEVIIFEIPTTKPWELVAYIPFGGWNECPVVEEMMAICKYWYEKHGAIPVTITHDVLEMSVPKTVSENESLELAKEHYAFTPDRVDQCTASGTLKEVEECLKASKIWYFWWD